MGPEPLRGSCERGNVPAPWEAPSAVGRSAQIEGELQSLGGEHSSWLATARVEGELHRQSVLPPCTPQSEVWVRWCRWGLGAGTWASEIRPGDRTGVGCAETTTTAHLNARIGCDPPLPPAWTPEVVASCLHSHHVLWGHA